MVISTHLPPPVMIESTEVRGVGDPHVVLELGHVLLGRRFFRERPGQHEFGLEHGAGTLDDSVQRCGHPADHRMANPASGRL